MCFGGLEWPQNSEKIDCFRYGLNLLLHHWIRYFLRTGGLPMEATKFHQIYKMPIFSIFPLVPFKISLENIKKVNCWVGQLKPGGPSKVKFDEIVWPLLADHRSPRNILSSDEVAKSSHT